MEQCFQHCFSKHYYYDDDDGLVIIVEKKGVRLDGEEVD